MSIKGNVLEHFSKNEQGTSSSSPHSLTHHAVFHSFLYDQSKYDADTTAAQSKWIIELLNIYLYLSF